MRPNPSPGPTRIHAEHDTLGQAVILRANKKISNRLGDLVLKAEGAERKV